MSEDRRLEVTENLLEDEEEKAYPMTAQEVIARIMAARTDRAEAPKQCGNGGCSSCSCGKKNNA